MVSFNNWYVQFLLSPVTQSYHKALLFITEYIYTVDSDMSLKNNSYRMHCRVPTTKRLGERATVLRYIYIA